MSLFLLSVCGQSLSGSYVRRLWPFPMRRNATRAGWCGPLRAPLGLSPCAE